MTDPTQNMPDVDSLFPAKSVDELFPADVERERYRRQTLGTSPVQDLIFGDTSVNPIARVLDAFGQGAKQAWGADSEERLSKEAEDALKVNEQLDAWTQGRGSIIKAANEALFRPAATQLMHEVRDAGAIFRGASAVFSGVQSAVQQVGVEAGQPIAGREAAAMFEAFPAGFRQASGIPHAPPHPLIAEIERAKRLGVIGAGEEGWKGNAEVHPPISTPQEAPVAKREGMPVDLFEAPKTEPVKPADSSGVAPESVPAALPIEAPKAEPAPIPEITSDHPIAQDVSGKLIAAGRPADEAAASGQIIASHYEARAARLEGAKGTAEELYKAEGPNIVGEGTKPPPSAEGAPVNVLPGKPTEGGAGAVVDPALREATMRSINEGNALPRDGTDVGDSSLNRTASWVIRNKETKEVVMETFDRAKVDALNVKKYEAVPIGEYLGEINGRPKTAAEDGQPAPLSRVGLGENIRRSAQQEWEPGRIVKVGFVDGLKVEGRVPAEHWGDADPYILTKGKNVYQAIPHKGLTKLSQADGKAMLARAKEASALDRELTQTVLEQRRGTLRGEIKIRPGDARNTIKLFKDANSSTFIHETGHQWLEELMGDAEHPKAPQGLKADAKTILDWFGVKDRAGIKTSHHELFARGFERYVMEGVAPSRELASVFAKFKDWLTRIYQTVTRLKSPINDEVRGVFDRLIALHPEHVTIEPEIPGKSFADIHEADAEHTTPEQAHPVAETVQAERDKVAARVHPEGQDARLANTADQTLRREAGNQEPDSHGNEGNGPGQEGYPSSTGEVGTGGNEIAPEGPRSPAVTRKEDPVSPHDKFPDKAGNIRLDNLNTPEDLNQIIRQTAAENNDFLGSRRSVSDAQMLDLAEAAGIDAVILNKKIGDAWTGPEVVALRGLFVKASQAVHDASNKVAESSAKNGGTALEADIKAYAEAKLRLRMIQEHVSSATAEASHTLRAFQKKFAPGMAEAKSIAASIEDATGQTLFQLEREAKFLSKINTPGQASKFVADSAKGNFRNAVLEYYINALISGPFTHTRYAVGNFVNALFTPLVEIPMASIARKTHEIVTGKNIDGPHLGEAGAQLYGIMKGSRDGLMAAIEAFQSGVSPPLPGERYTPHFLASQTTALPDKFGEIYRLPSKSVAGIHSFFKSLRYEQNIQSLAYRAAMNEGLEGEAFNARIAELSTSPTETMMKDATKNALRELYMAPNDYHSFMGKLTSAVNSNLAAKIIVPFMKIGTQITRNAFIDRTPLGLLSKDVRGNLLGRNGTAEQSLQAGKIMAGTALIGATVGMVLEGMATGDGPTDPAQRRVWLLSHRPNSIQIGDLYLSYQGLGSLGMLMRFSANMTETAHALGDKDLATLAVAGFEGITTSVLDESFLRGLKDMTQAMYHFKEYGPSYLKSQITNWMPWSVGMSQVARKMDPYSRETHGIFQAAQAKVPWLSEQLMPRRDMFGEPIRNSGPNPDYANDQVIKAMDALHIGVGKIGKKVRGVDLTDQQYDDLARVAGRMAKMKLNGMIGIISNPNIPAASRVELIHQAISSSRETARSLIMMQSMNTPHDIVKQANDAKLAKFKETVH